MTFERCAGIKDHLELPTCQPFQHSTIPTIPTFSHSNFPPIPTIPTFQLADHSNLPNIPTFQLSWENIQLKQNMTFENICRDQRPPGGNDADNNEHDDDDDMMDPFRQTSCFLLCWCLFPQPVVLCIHTS
jgi:hypothetical protein